MLPRCDMYKPPAQETTEVKMNAAFTDCQEAKQVAWYNWYTLIPKSRNQLIEALCVGMTNYFPNSRDHLIIESWYDKLFSNISGSVN